MVAPTRVSEEIPQEPAMAERPGSRTAELTLAETATQDRAVPAGDLMETAPAEPAAAEAEQAETASAEAEHAEASPAEAELAEVALAAAELVEAASTEVAEAAHTDAEPEALHAELAKVKPAGAELAGAELAGAGKAGQENRAGEESRDVGPLAVVGIIIGVIALVGVAAGVLAMVTHGFKPKTVVTYRPAAVFGLHAGQCVNSGSNSLSFTLVSCASPHDAEVFARLSLPAAAWPGTSAVRQEAGDSCASRLSGYVNPQLATIGLTQEYVYPNQDAWQAGQRTVVCEVSAGSGRLTGSVRAKN